MVGRGASFGALFFRESQENGLVNDLVGGGGGGGSMAFEGTGGGADEVAVAVADGGGDHGTEGSAPERPSNAAGLFLEAIPCFEDSEPVATHC